MKINLITSLVAATVVGCAGKFTLIDRSDGQIYAGATDGSTISASGTVTLQIEGERYTGPWIYQPSGGSFSFSNFAGVSTATGIGNLQTPSGRVYSSNLTGTATSTGTSTTYGVSAVGNGMLNARSGSGKFIRCVFTFNTMQNTGIGECLRNDARSYDLFVKR